MKLLTRYLNRRACDGQLIVGTESARKFGVSKWCRRRLVNGYAEKNQGAHGPQSEDIAQRYGERSDESVGGSAADHQFQSVRGRSAPACLRIVSRARMHAWRRSDGLVCRRARADGSAGGATELILKSVRRARGLAGGGGM